MRQLDDRSQGRKNALKCEVARDILQCFGSLRLQVTGHSMLPSVLPGDVLLIQRCDVGEISPGDIVLYSREARLVAHRVICAADLEEPRLVTQGDALPTQDPAISATELLGRVSQIIRAGECGAPATIFTLKNKIVARAARYSTVFARLLVHLHLTRANSRNRETLC